MFKAQFHYLIARRFVLLHDVTMVGIAWIGAYWLRFNLSQIPEPFNTQAYNALPLVCVLQLVVFILFGVHRGAWRFTSTHDLMTVIKGVIFGAAGIAGAIFLATRLAAVPRAVLPMYAVLLVGLLCGPRLLYRLFREREISKVGDKRVLVVGAGVAGDMLVRDFKRARPRVYEPVAFVDDDSQKHGREIHGLRVLGAPSEIPMLVDKLNIDLVLLAIPSATASEMRRAVEYCEEAGAPFRTLPKVTDIIDGAATVRDLRDVELDDLLGRQPVKLDWSGIEAGLSGKCVLITGSGGSIGSELSRQVLRAGPAQLILFEKNEFNLYMIKRVLEQATHDVEVVALLGDVCDHAAVAHLFKHYKPEVVFHAAAYKHVPLLQRQARETMKNNVIGTHTVAALAADYSIESFVLISTDKAVNPSSMMGASKRAAEAVCVAFDALTETRFTIVRFGNVLGSAGSVVPLFARQIAEGGPVTVTHPEMTRYFMTLAEASQLILQASLIGQGSEIYVLNMGEPVNIAYLARQMILLSGRLPEKEVEIVFTGLRSGEKLKEELFHPEEVLSDTGYDKILLAATRSVDAPTVLQDCLALEQACSDYNELQIEAIINRLVPEYQWGEWNHMEGLDETA